MVFSEKLSRNLCHELSVRRWVLVRMQDTLEGSHQCGQILGPRDDTRLVEEDPSAPKYVQQQWEATLVVPVRRGSRDARRLLDELYVSLPRVPGISVVRTAIKRDVEAFITGYPKRASSSR